MRKYAMIVCSIALTGCATRHHDILLFGTDTSFGVNVGADPAATQITQVSIGYRRREAVYMPLVINARDSALVCRNADDPKAACIPSAQIPVASPKDLIYAGRAEGTPEDDGGQDTYSVCASFGGKAAAKPGEAEVAVAQFFATGIAAQRLSSRPEAAQLISTDAANGAKGKAEGKLEALTAATPAELERAKNPPVTDDQRITNIESYVFTAPDAATQTARRTKIVTGTELTPAQVAQFNAATTPANMRTLLNSEGFINFLDQMSSNAKD